MSANQKKPVFDRYQLFMVAILTILQFTIILDFMVLSPLSAILLDELSITTAQFGLAVSAYAFSAGISGIMVAGFADKFDRKRLLLFFYAGFILGTFLCGFAPNYPLLLAARIITGLFGGVIGSISYAIITDLFALQVRGRVMGYIQMAFAASQVMGIPLGLYLANKWDWHSPFILIASVSLGVYAAIVFRMRPITAHLALQTNTSAFRRLVSTLSRKEYIPAFVATTLLATGGFMLMPFGAAFSVNNLGISLDELPLVYLITGIVTFFSGPLIGRFSDQIGKYKTFIMGSALSIVLVLVYTNLGITPLWIIIILSAVLFMGITARMISASALMTAVPDAADRGGFMSVSASVQQVSGGIASAAAGLIIFQNSSGYLEHYPILGIVVAVSMLAAILLLYRINRYVQTKEGDKEAIGEKVFVEAP